MSGVNRGIIRAFLKSVCFHADFKGMRMSIHDGIYAASSIQLLVKCCRSKSVDGATRLHPAYSSHQNFLSSYAYIYAHFQYY